MLVVVDDLQLADAQSQELVAQVAARLTGMPLLLAVSIDQPCHQRGATDSLRRLRKSAHVMCLAHAPAVPTKSSLDLTPRELAVAQLAASGKTNRAIASELYVTVKGVEWHLANAYRKLGISSRSELASTFANSTLI